MSTKNLPDENRNFWRGPTIRLRAIEPRDYDRILTLPDEPDTERDRYEDAIGFPRSPDTEHDTLQEIAKQVGKGDFLYCFIENEEGETVGYINSFDCVRRNGTFKYALAIKYPFRRRGYGREAVTIFVRYFFRELGYQKCTSLVYAFNEHSIRFHEALGFKFEGRLRSMHFTNGQYFDELYFGVTAAEWNDIDPVPPLKNYRPKDEPVLP